VKELERDMDRPRTVEEICEWWKRIDEAAANAPEVRAADGVIQASVRATLHTRQRADRLQAEVERVKKIAREALEQLSVVIIGKSEVEHKLAELRAEMDGLVAALKDANVALERVSAHFWKIRPEHLEPSEMMNQVDSVLCNNRAFMQLKHELLGEL